jgi:S1-C subfamily serine protease
MRFIKALFLFAILFAYEANAKITSGTAFFIAGNGILVTNYHVIKGAKKINLRLSNGQIIDAVVLKTNPENDLAIIKAKHANTKLAKPLKIRDSKEVKKGEKVYAMGFPQIQFQGLEPKLTDGMISSLSGPNNDKRIYQITNPVQPGNSGGPLFTDDGNVIGVVVASLDSIAVARETGSLPQNVNFAIKSQYLIEMLANKKQTGLQKKVKQKKFSEVVKEVEESLVIVLVQK